jgi:voltage-dependent potassium channel beta subunit
MKYRSLGKSGLQVSVLSFGAWVTFGNQADVDLAADLLKTAYDAGVIFFDNAEVYARGQAEIVMGKAIQKLGWRRDSYLVSSKVHGGSIPDPNPNQWGLSRKHIYDACYQAMNRLQVDYLDLYFCHRPDARVPMEETVRAMTELIQQGKVRYWGTSEWSAQQLMEAYSAARQYNLIPPTMEQPHYNMFERYRFEVEYGRLYDKIGLGTTIFSPLASGMLTGKYSSGTPSDSRINLPGYEWLKEIFESDEGKAKIEKVKELGKLADELDTNVARLALAWCIKNPNVSTAIMGASKVSQLEDNLKAVDVVDQLSEDLMERIEKILDNKPEPMEFQA